MQIFKTNYMGCDYLTRICVITCNKKQISFLVFPLLYYTVLQIRQIIYLSTGQVEAEVHLSVQQLTCSVHEQII